MNGKSREFTQLDQSRLCSVTATSHLWPLKRIKTKHNNQFDSSFKLATFQVAQWPQVVSSCCASADIAYFPDCRKF